MGVGVTIFFYACIFLFGIVVGSFLNVCIYRIPLKETVVTERSHCMSCGHTLAWYDLFPLFSWISLGGKCRYCKAKISKQYPIVEALNGILWVMCFLTAGFYPHMILSVNEYGVWTIFSWFLACLVCSALIVVTVIDWRTFEIPFGTCVFIFVIALIKLISKMAVEAYFVAEVAKEAGAEATFWELINGFGDWPEYVIGFFTVSGIFFIIFLISRGNWIGLGDVKLMAPAGLFLGWKLSLVALILGCLYGVIVHLTRMKLQNKDHQLALGPYLSAGIVSAIWFGEPIVEWYSGFFG